MQECDLSELLRLAAKKSLGRGLVLHNSETSSFKAVAGKKVRGGESGESDLNSALQGTKTKHERKEEKDRERREKKERRRERKEKKMRKLQLQKNVSSSTEESPKVGLIAEYINDRTLGVYKTES